MEAILGALFIVGIFWFMSAVSTDIKLRKQDAISKDYTIDIPIERYKKLYASFSFSASSGDIRIHFVGENNTDLRHDLSDKEWEFVSNELNKFVRSKEREFGLFK